MNKPLNFIFQSSKQAKLIYKILFLIICSFLTNCPQKKSTSYLKSTSSIYHVECGYIYDALECFKSAKTRNDYAGICYDPFDSQNFDKTSRDPHVRRVFSENTFKRFKLSSPYCKKDSYSLECEIDILKKFIKNAKNELCN